MSETEEFVASIDGTWDYATLPANATVGLDCFLERRSSFAAFRSQHRRGLVIGDRVTVFMWTSFNVEPSGSVQIGDDSVLVGATFMCAESIRIGHRCLVSYNVTIADSDFHPRNPDERIRDAIANAPFGDRASRPDIISRPVRIGDDVWIGIGAIILKGVAIGDRARVAAGAVVTSDVPPDASVAGNPARITGATA